MSGHTERATQGFTPTFRLVASFAMPWKTSLILAGAAVGSGRENGALTSALRLGDSFDMVTINLFSKDQKTKNGGGYQGIVTRSSVQLWLGNSWMQG